LCYDIERNLHQEKQMRRIMQVAVATLMLAAGPALADDRNYNGNSAGNTNNGGNANCHSSTMLGGCGESVTEAPLPLAGAGLLGSLFVAGAAGVSLAVKRRRRLSVEQ
jgi:hypothetical protein